jgi:hypothetical protein
VHSRLLTWGSHQQAKVSFFVLAFGSRVGQDVSICRCMCIDILILVCRLYNLIFSVPITSGSDNYPKINRGLARSPPSPLQHTPAHNPHTNSSRMLSRMKILYVRSKSLYFIRCSFRFSVSEEHLMIPSTFVCRVFHPIVTTVTSEHIAATIPLFPWHTLLQQWPWITLQQ